MPAARGPERDRIFGPLIASLTVEQRGHGWEEGIAFLNKERCLEHTFYKTILIQGL